MYHGGAEVREELQLPQRVARRRGDGEHSQFLRSVLESEPAGEHAVAGSVLEHVLGPAAHHPEASRHGVGPLVQVLCSVQDDRRVSGGAAG